MLCENCQETQATVHQIQVVDDQITHVALCESCAEEGVFGHTGEGPSLPDVLSELPDSGSAGETVCPGCGLRYEEFAASGSLGCGRCFDAFEKRLEPLIHRVHGADRHVDGEEDTGTGLGTVSRQQKLDILEQRLEESVQREDYEEAARLRDRIAELKEGNHPESSSD